MNKEENKIYTKEHIKELKIYLKKIPKEILNKNKFKNYNEFIKIIERKIEKTIKDFKQGCLN